MNVVTDTSAAGDAASGDQSDPDEPGPKRSLKRRRSAVHTHAGAVNSSSTGSPEGEDRGLSLSDQRPEESEHPTIDMARLRHWLKQIEPHLPQPIDRVGAQVFNDQQMQALNRRFHREDCTTDVLTFPESEPGEPIRADIAIGADRAAEQATARGHEVEQELLLYVVHGLLHCAGYDDQTDAAAKLMHEEEDRILQAIGLGPIYYRAAEIAEETGEGGGPR